MRFHLSAVSAWIIRDLGVLDPRFADQINRVNSKAGTCYLRAPIGELQKARDALEAWMTLDAFTAADGRFHRETYRSVLKEVTYLADPGTSAYPESDHDW